MKILYLPLKKEWYEMIEAGIKKEEYREIKPFWVYRLLEWRYIADGPAVTVKRVTADEAQDICDRIGCNRDMPSFCKYDAVCFSYGYTKRRMTFECKGITIGRGRPEWGAPDRDTFIIKLGERIQ